MKKNNKRIVMMASIILVFAVAISGTIAWLFTQTNEVVNTFKPASAPNIIEEKPPEINDNIKEDVYIRVPSITEDPKSIPVYIRAKYIVTWQNGNNVLPDKPVEGTHYTLERVTNGKWKELGDYFYYTEVINPGESTDNFINKVKVKAKAPVDGYTLNVEILSQSIQADGENSAGEKPVQLAWGVTITEPNATYPTGAVEVYSPVQP